MKKKIIKEITMYDIHDSSSFIDRSKKMRLQDLGIILTEGASDKSAKSSHTDFSVEFDQSICRRTRCSLLSDDKNLAISRVSKRKVAMVQCGQIIKTII